MLGDVARPQVEVASRPTRVVAGGPNTNDVLKCQLKPLNRSDYQATFTDAQWARWPRDSAQLDEPNRTFLLCWGPAISTLL